MPPKDSGFEIIERDMSRPSTTSSMGLLDVTDQDLSGSADSQGYVCSVKIVIFNSLGENCDILFG